MDRVPGCDKLFVVNHGIGQRLRFASQIRSIRFFQQFVADSEKMKKGEPKLSRKMGYISSVRDAKDILEKLYKSNNNNKKS